VGDWDDSGTIQGRFRDDSVAIEAKSFSDLLHPIDQFRRLTNRATLYVPIGQ
jgi:hypothetical protein